MRRHEGTTRAGFTLIELLVSISIIALLITLVAVGVSHVTKISRGTAERQTVVQLNQAVQAFKQEFGFLPPLVTHKETAPVVRPVVMSGNTILINTYGGANTDVSSGTNGGFSGNAGFLEGFSDGDPRNAGVRMMSSDWSKGTIGEASTTPDYRFSEYTLPYFLVGALGRGIDGVDGPGMFKPNADGTFDFGSKSNSSRVNKVTGRAFPPFVDTSRRSPRLETDLEIAAKDDTDLTTTDPVTNQATVETVRVRLISPSGKPYRFYRWSPRKVVTFKPSYYNPATNMFNRQEEDADRLDVPSLLGDPRADANLRGAEYAIVSPGANGYFGDMNLEATSADELGDMAAKLGAKVNIKDELEAANVTVRKAARADNVVEVGR